jgi:hypothetical protein
MRITRAGDKAPVHRLGLAALLIVCSFAFWHSGARADALCEDERFVSSGALSTWPPGASCTFGEPAATDTLLNPWFLWTLLFVLGLALVLGELWARVMRRTRDNERQAR